MKKVLSYFRSMTFGMILLVIVMALSLAGSLIPQQEAAMTYVNAYGSQTAMLLLGLGFTDIFHTWYFYTLEILLCLNLLLCSILRFPKTRKAGERLKRRAQEAALDKPFHYIEEYQKITSYLSAVHFTKAETSNGALVYTKHLMGFYGSFFVHLSILLVLLFGSLVLMTPKVTDQTVMPGEALTLSDGTTITCDSFHIQDETGKLDYASVLTAASPDGKQSKTQEIRVNEPMRFGSYKIYQQTYQRNGIYFEALYPAYYREEDGSFTLITSTDRSYPDPVYRIQSITDGMSAAVLAFPGEEIHMEEITFTFLDPAEYPGLRIKHVAAWLYGGLYFSFGLMVAALYLCFFTVPVAVKVTEEGYSHWQRCALSMVASAEREASHAWRTKERDESNDGYLLFRSADHLFSRVGYTVCGLGHEKGRAAQNRPRGISGGLRPAYGLHRLARHRGGAAAAG